MIQEPRESRSRNQESKYLGTRRVKIQEPGELRSRNQEDQYVGTRMVKIKEPQELRSRNKEAQDAWITRVQISGQGGFKIQDSCRSGFRNHGSCC